ncbi:MAG TPA: hypothetical protein VG709_03650 [Actinomycetota bacterium]|nr:hypothetical protein [Actinomycetota bacterium]
MRVDAHAHVTRDGWIGERWWNAYAEEAARRVGLPAETVHQIVVPAMFDDDEGSLQLGAMDEARIDIAVAYPFDWTLAERSVPPASGGASRTSGTRGSRNGTPVGCAGVSAPTPATTVRSRRSARRSPPVAPSA